MTWGQKGKGKSSPASGSGQWVFVPDDKAGNHGGKSHGKGNGKQNHGKAGKGYGAGVDKLQGEIKKLQVQLTEAQTTQKDIQKKTQAALRKGQDVLKKEGGGGGDVCIVCPSCGTEHSNPNKYKCRIRACGAILRPDTVPSHALVTPKEPKNPLLTGYFQALLQDAGAKECLQENIVGPEPAEVPVEEEEDEDMGDQKPLEDRRAKEEETLQKMREWNVDPAILKQQERLLNAMPKPKKVKTTQPILDVAKLHQALSQASEFHEAAMAKHTQIVQSCERAIQDAQEALEKAKVLQAEGKRQATSQLEEIKMLIQKKQQETQAVLAPAGGVAAPAPQEQADQTLMLHATQEWLINQSCPDHIKFFLQNLWIANPTQPNPAGPTSSGAGADLAGTNVHPNPAWEAA